MEVLRRRCGVACGTEARGPGPMPRSGVVGQSLFGRAAAGEPDPDQWLGFADKSDEELQALIADCEAAGDDQQD